MRCSPVIADHDSVVDTFHNAYEAKTTFGDDYEMYCAYCEQWVTDDGIHLLPVSEAVWRTL